VNDLLLVISVLDLHKVEFMIVDRGRELALPFIDDFLGLK
jgi:hypothetical protein